MHISQHTWFTRIKHPSRYLGGEINAITKDPADVEVSIALAFPDVYEIGMSHVGFKILYHILNSLSWLAAERVFAPWIDLEQELRDRGLPLTTLESDRPLLEFDLIGFSLQHELCYTNILSMLDLAGVSLASEQRGLDEPLIIAGGPACFNPEPVADLFDAIVVGDGEEVAVGICSAVREWKRAGGKEKLELLEDLATIPGVYIPSFFSVHYDARGVVERIEPLRTGYDGVEKAVVPDINSYPFPTRQVVPLAEAVHDRFTIEIARGCSRGCRFCQAGMIYRPVRERAPQEIVRIAGHGLHETGFEDLSLLSLSSGDYSCVLPLVRELMARAASRHVAVSFSSLRADGIISPLMEEIKKVRKTSFTIAPEAGSQRMRDVINKGLTEEQIFKTAREIYEGGWNLIKLYFMIGLPGEQESDLDAIVELSKKIARLAPRARRHNVLNVSVATFVPKSHTPFQWLGQLGLEESKRRINSIRDGLRGKRVRVKWNKPEASWLEGIFSRGDRKLSGVLLEAWRQGARFDSWSEHLNLDIWRNAFAGQHLDPDFYLLRQRDTGEVLPWDHIRSGISKEFLLEEWQRSIRGEATLDCREQCSNCGVCDELAVSPVLFDGSPPVGKHVFPMPRMKEGIKRFRVYVTKLDRGRYLSHLEFVRLFIRAFRRAGVDLAYSNGYHPMPRVSFVTALPVGVESLDEVVDLCLYDGEDLSRTIDLINKELPPGIRALAMEEVPTNERPPQLKESAFRVTVEGSLREEDLIHFLELPACRVVRKRSKGERSIDIRSQVKRLRLLSSNEIEMVVRHGGGPEMKPSELIKEIFALTDSQAEQMRVLKTKGILA
ncbi:MAG: TIGR03960 family B12-binding radical SAM protein [Deltaproteobacteria bacterium]|nr:TIGR03960 family B12-binding radical SAM protein [Deltaproteobacteria bacterium]